MFSCAFWIKLTTRISLKKSHSLYIKLHEFVLLGGVLVNIFLNSFKQYLILSVFYWIHSHSRLLSERLGALFRDPVVFVLVLLLIGLWWGLYYVWFKGSTSGLCCSVYLYEYSGPWIGNLLRFASFIMSLFTLSSLVSFDLNFKICYVTFIQ